MDADLTERSQSAYRGPATSKKKENACVHARSVWRDGNAIQASIHGSTQPSTADSTMEVSVSQDCCEIYHTKVKHWN